MTTREIRRWVYVSVGILITVAFINQLLPLISLQAAITRIQAAVTGITFQGPVHFAQAVTQSDGITGNTFLRRDGTEAMTGELDLASAGLQYNDGSVAKTFTASGPTLVVCASNA